MGNPRLHQCVVALAGLAMLALRATALGDEQPKPQWAPLLAVPKSPVPHVSKGSIEVPIETALARRTAPAPGAVASLAADANPRVTPVKVRWHATFAAACAAAKKSGKPVFLFQMMGKLDEQFC